MRMKRYAPLLVALCGLLALGLMMRSQGQPADRQAGAPAPGSLAPRSVAAAELPRAASRSRKFTMIAVGDIMTDRNVGSAIAANGVHSILAKVRDLTSAADVSFANLESPLSTVGPHAPSDCVFRARPETVQVLLDGGFDIVTLANNHTFNAGREGLLQTFDVLDKHGLRYCGASRERRGDQATVLEVGESRVRIGFIGATDLSIGHGSYNKVSPDRANLIAQIQAARPSCDILVVTFHWGEEYQSLPDQRQKNTAHAAIKAGADLVLGHHPHTLQGVEVYQGKPILYSMGNFVFDQREGERMESAIFRIEYADGWGWQIMAKPIWIPRSRMGPIYPETARRDKILARLARISKPLGTTLQIKDGKAWLRIPAGAPKGNQT
jgi:poly-gamma-glutamate synthesis protein (capsule biosynthesis protein)